MESFRLFGVLVNTVAVMAGALIGMLISKIFKCPGNRVASANDGVFKGMALCVLSIGIAGAVKAAVNGQLLSALSGATAGGEALVWNSDIFGEHSLVVIISMALGTLIGEMLKLDHLVTVLGERIEAKTKSKLGNVAQGFVSASLLFCVGSMTIVGSLNSGIAGDHEILLTKSMIDFVSAIVLSTAMGFGVFLSAGFVLGFEGVLTLLAQWVAPCLTTDIVTCMSGIGSILIIGMALNMLGLTKLRVMNFMPAILLPILLIPLSEWLSTLF